MTKPKILYYEVLNFRPSAIAELRRNFEVVTAKDPDNLQNLPLEDIDACFAPLGYFFDKELMERMPKLMAVASNTTGDAHINKIESKKKKIKVLTLKGEKTFLKKITPTAELAWGLIITATRNILPAVDSVRQGKWQRWPFGAPSMLSRLSLGIVGLGRLGSMVAKYAKAFGMKIYYYDPYVKSKKFGAVKQKSLIDLARKSDIVTLHAPSNEETENLIDSEFFTAMRGGSYFINTARAEIVDHKALLDALKSGKLSGVASDVFPGEYEPNISEKIVISDLYRYCTTHDNLIFTPHIGGSTYNAWEETQLHTIYLLKNFFKKRSRK